jgi:hypothetical protein
MAFYQFRIFTGYGNDLYVVPYRKLYPTPNSTLQSPTVNSPLLYLLQKFEGQLNEMKWDIRIWGRIRVTYLYVTSQIFRILVRKNASMRNETFTYILPVAV